MNAYLSSGTIWVEVRISKSIPPDDRDGEKTQKELLSMARTARLQPICDNMNRTLEGLELFHAGQYDKAMVVLQAVLESEAGARTLDQSAHRNAVVCLALCHAFTGAGAQCKAVLETGLRDDPNYPLYLFNLACYYAETDDLKQAIALLKRAFANKGECNAGESVPDPTKDSSFARYMQTGEFLAALQEMGLKPAQGVIAPSVPQVRVPIKEGAYFSLQGHGMPQCRLA